MCLPLVELVRKGEEKMSDNTPEESLRQHLRQRIANPSSRVSSIALSPDGTLLAIGTCNNHILLFRAAKGTLIDSWQVIPGLIEESRRIHGKMLETTAGFWDLFFLDTLALGYTKVSGLAFRPRGGLQEGLCAALGNGSVGFWNPQGKQIKLWKEEGSSISNLVFSSNGQLVVYLDRANITIRHIVTGEVRKKITIEEPTSVRQFLAVSPDNRYLAVGRAAYERKITLYSLSGGKSDTISLHEAKYSLPNWTSLSKEESEVFDDEISALAWDHKVNTLVVGTNRGNILIWQPIDEKRLPSIIRTGYKGAIGSLASLEGSILALLISEQELCLWKSTSNSAISLIRNETDILPSIVASTFSQDLSSLAVASEDGRVFIWNTNGQLLSSVDISSLPAGQTPFMPLMVVTPAPSRASSQPTTPTQEQLLDSGDEHSKAARYTEALTAYEQAIHLDPSDATAYTKKGETLYKVQRYEEALTALDQAIHLDPTSAFAYAYKGKTLNELQRYEEALSAYEQVIRLNSTTAYVFDCKGEILFRLQRDEEALTAFDQAIRLDPNDRIAYSCKGHIFYLLQRYDEALSTFEQVILLDPNNADAYAYKGKTLCALHRHEEALNDYEQSIQLNPTDAVVYTNKGDALYTLQRYEEAISSYEQAIHLNPSLTTAYLYKGFILYLLQRHKESLNTFEQLTILDPTDERGYRGKGIVLKELQNYIEALNAFEQVIKINTADTFAYKNKGIILHILQRYEEALIAFEQVILLDPTNAITYNSKSDTLNKLQRYEEALIACDQAIGLDPHLAGAYHTKGETYLELKRYDEALAVLDLAISLDPTNAPIYENKGQALEQLGRSEEASQAYAMAKELYGKQ